MSDLLLSVEQVEVVYHDVVTAVQGVNLTARAGQIVCLLGSNGAGKTTTLRAISGFIGLDHARVTGGRIVFAGEDIANAAPHICARAGIALVAERDKVFEQLSVRENLEIGMVAGKTGSQAAGGDRLDLKGIYRFFPELERLTGRQAGYLSGGERQMLAIGSALLTSPRLLLIDELSLGLAPVVVERLAAALTDIRDALGITILLVEQNANIALSIADYGFVMENGRIVLDGDAGRLLAHGDIQEFYLGQGAAAGERRSYRAVKQYARKRRWYG